MATEKAVMPTSGRTGNANYAHSANQNWSHSSNNWNHNNNWSNNNWGHNNWDHYFNRGGYGGWGWGGWGWGWGWPWGLGLWWGYGGWGGYYGDYFNPYGDYCASAYPESAYGYNYADEGPYLANHRTASMRPPCLAP